MFVLKLLRWFNGYTEFSATGMFPERLLNLSTKRGIQLWGIKSHGDTLICRTKASHYRYLLPIARSCKLKLKHRTKVGLPFYIRKYKNRTGLAVGAVLFLLIGFVLSGFVWNIDIKSSSDINNAEMRANLAELGLYEGAKISSIDVTKLEQNLTLKSDNIAWVSVNITGSLVTVEVSPKIEKPKQEVSTEPSNIVAKADGVITRLEVKDGVAQVKSGEAVVKGQMLVNGILEYETGGYKIKHSDARIFAQTQRHISVTVPLNEKLTERTGEVTEKKMMRILWFSAPITLCGTPNGECASKTKREHINIFDSFIPIEITTETWNSYTEKNIKHSKAEAEKAAKERIRLKEAFLLDDVENYKATYRSTVKDGKLTLVGTYTCEEDISSQQPINIDTNEPADDGADEKTDKAKNSAG